MADKEVSLKDVYDLVEGMRKENRELYVYRSEFNPVRTVTYGLVGMILFAVFGAILTMVIVRPADAEYTIQQIKHMPAPSIMRFALDLQ